jgi:hypothetical protein
MEILEAFDLTGSFGAAAELADCDHHTVRRYVEQRAAGRAPERTHTAQLIDPFLDKVEEWVERSHAKIGADVVHHKLLAMGFTGSERTTRRAVAAAKRAWRAGHRRVFRPWIPESGLCKSGCLDHSCRGRVLRAASPPARSASGTSWETYAPAPLAPLVPPSSIRRVARSAPRPRRRRHRALRDMGSPGTKRSGSDGAFLDGLPRCLQAGCRDALGHRGRGIGVIGGRRRRDLWGAVPVGRLVPGPRVMLHGDCLSRLRPRLRTPNAISRRPAPARYSAGSVARSN